VVRDAKGEHNSFFAFRVSLLIGKEKRTIDISETAARMAEQINS
jgi:hypothetical protein